MNARWLMRAAQVGYTIGLLFAYWLFYQAYFKIGALCPWCLLITVTTPSYMFVMFHDPRGIVMLIGGVIWMSLGIFVMVRMINFKF